MNKIKEHLKEHKLVYTAGACLVGGVIIGVVVSSVMKSNTLVTNRPLQVLTWKSTQVIDVHIEALGDPGNIIQDVHSGIVYASQSQASRELGINNSLISRQLNGKIPHAKGHVFTRLGKAHVSAS